LQQEPPVEIQDHIREIEQVRAGKVHLTQAVVGIRVFPVMAGTQRYRGEIRRLLGHPSGTQGIGVGGFNHG
jgi:hypothetical protein